MLSDERALRTVEQVLQAGRTGQRRRRIDRSVIDLGAVVQECLQTVQTPVNPAPIQYSESLDDGSLEHILQCELHDSRISGTLDLAEIRAGQNQVWIERIQMVWQIE